MTEADSRRQGIIDNIQGREEFFSRNAQVGAGVQDGLSALIAAKWNFDFLWVSSFCCSASAGLPDVGILGPEEILNTVRTVYRCTPLPIVVDLDSGYGDVIKIYSVTQAMAHAGATALCIEDNPLSKRCSLYGGYDRILVTIDEHVARIRSALEAVKVSECSTKIIARTEALVAGMGVEEARRRANAYADAGADAIFIQSLDASGREVLDFGQHWQGRTPIFIAPTRMPEIEKQTFFDAGISHFIFANHGLRAAYAAMDRIFRTLSQATCSHGIEKDITKVSDVAAMVGARKVQDIETMLGMVTKENKPTPIASTSKPHTDLTSLCEGNKKAV